MLDHARAAIPEYRAYFSLFWRYRVTYAMFEIIAKLEFVKKMSSARNQLEFDENYSKYNRWFQASRYKLLYAKSHFVRSIVSVRSML